MNFLHNMMLIIPPAGVLSDVNQFFSEVRSNLGSQLGSDSELVIAPGRLGGVSAFRDEPEFREGNWAHFVPWRGLPTSVRESAQRRGHNPCGNIAIIIRLCTVTASSYYTSPRHSNRIVI